MAAMSISEGATPNVFHATLGAIWTATIKDRTPSWKGYLEERTTDKRWFDDVEYVDPGLWDETDEGNEIDLDEYSEGYVTRYRPIKFAKRLVIPEEIKEDAVYEEAYAATEMLGRTCVQTQDYYAVGIIDDAATAGAVGGDGVCLANASHPIKGGSTISNILSPALTPSNTAIQTMLIAAEKMKGGNGYIAGMKIKGYAGPSNWKFRMKEVLKSEMRDDTANHTINALKGEGGDSYSSIPQMSSTTNWFAKTDAPRGACFVWRRRPRFKTATEIRNESETHTGSARWLVNWTNWRTFFFSLS
jgi:hypothetical protein